MGLADYAGLATIASLTGHAGHTGYARIQAIGINLRPPSEKNHNFQKNAPISINKVTFFSCDICPHD